MMQTGSPSSHVATRSERPGSCNVQRSTSGGPLGPSQRLVLFAFITLAVQAVPAAAPWWDSDWKVRRPIELKGARRSSHAPLVAHVQFRDFGHVNTDASDVRVVSDKGKVVASRVKFYHPRLYCVVAFQPESTTWRGFVYYGNPKAPKPETKWEGRSGLFLTTYRRKGQGCNNWREMEKTVRDSMSEPDGAGFRRAIFDGYNPFGASTDFVSVYDGYFYASRTGTYRIATISDNASFVFIDGQLVAQWPGRHGIQGGQRGEHNGPVSLREGAHRVQYYHLQFTGTTVAELAWFLPGRRRPEVILPEDFLPAYEAEVGLQERQNDPTILEFSAVPVSTLAFDGHHYLRWRFGNLCGVPGSPAVTSQWDFGNGLTSNERNPFVWFFHPGDYRVTLRTTLRRGETKTLQQWVRVADLIQLDPSERGSRPFQLAAEEVARYPIDGLSPEDRRAMLALLTHRGKHDAIERVCGAWLDDVYRKGERVPVEVVLELGRVLTEVRENAADAERAYEEAVRHLRPDDPLGYQVLLALGELRVRYLRKYDAAIAVLQQARQRVKPANHIYRRRIAIALGDAYRAQQKRNEARSHYEEAERLGQPSHGDAAVRSSFGLSVEAFLERGDSNPAYEKLEEWAGRFPTDKLGGYWSLLMGRCLMAFDYNDEAAEELDLAAKLDPFGNYTRDILEQLGRAYTRLQRYNEAIDALQSAANLFDDPVKKKTLEEEIARLKRSSPRRR